MGLLVAHATGSGAAAQWIQDHTLMPVPIRVRASAYDSFRAAGGSAISMEGCHDGGVLSRRS